jgi:hypothetical protein
MMHLLSKRMLLKVSIEATVTRVGVEYVGAQVLMLKRSLKKRAQGHAPRPSLTSMLRKSKEKEKAKANLVSYVGSMLKQAHASMVTTVDLCMKCPRRNQRKKDKEVAAQIRHSPRRPNIPPEGELCGTPSKMMISKRPRPKTRMKTQSRWSECCARKWQS